MDRPITRWVKWQRLWRLWSRYRIGGAHALGKVTIGEI